MKNRRNQLLINAINSGLVFVIGLGALLVPILDVARKEIGWVGFFYPLLIFFVLGFCLQQRFDKNEKTSKP